jgi:tetratricopeptide (TPR) repeat protein
MVFPSPLGDQLNPRPVAGAGNKRSSLHLQFGDSQEHRMKKLVLATAMALASVALVAAPALRAQENPSGTIQIQDPAEFNAYQTAITQTDPTAKASALEDFLTKYPNSVAKKTVLDQLIVAYEQLNQPDKVISASTRLLQLDPNNFKAIFASVYFKRAACQANIDPSTGDSKDPQTCDDASALAQKGLTAPKPSDVSDADWKNMTDTAYPIFHSAIALDYLISKKDYAAAIKEFTTALMLLPEAQTRQGLGLVDTLNLAEAYAKPGPSRDEIKAIWFYARAWNFAPANFKPQIEQKLEYWYKRYHGTIDSPEEITQQISAIKAQAAQTLFPPANFTIAAAPTPQELAHHALTSGDPKMLNLEDKEFILANASQQDAQQLWGLLQGQLTPVPGIVINAQASVLKVSVAATAAAKPRDYVVKLNTPGSCASVPPPPSELHVSEARTYLQANGASADVSAIEGLSSAHKIVIEPAVTAIDMAVTQDAKDAKNADFNVNLKEPLSCKEAPQPGVELKLQPAEELDGTYDTYTAIPATATEPARAQIVLKEGFVQQEKKAAPVHHHPAPAHHPGD